MHHELTPHAACDMTIFARRVSSVWNQNERAGRSHCWPTVLLLVATYFAPEPVAAQSTASIPVVGQRLPRWSVGTLDIHQLSTGKGNAALIIMPDGTTMLIDAGDAMDAVPETAPHPDASHTPAEWIVRYIRRHVPDSTRALDYALLTHLHVDHMGQISASSPMASDGTYRLGGITHVGSLVEIGTMIDRGWPDYSYPAPVSDSVVANYRRFLVAQRTRGMIVEKFIVGSASQVRLRRDASRYPSFAVRNIVGNGDVWTGAGTNTRATFPPVGTLAVADMPSENMCSLGIRISYGDFGYFTGGDLQGTADPGFPAWHSVESSIAAVIGPVDVHVVNHHGSIGAESETFLKALRSTVLVIPSWAPSHPAPDVLKRVVNSRLAPARRYVFATDMRESTRTVIGARADALAAPPGHILVRVEAGGARYWVASIANRDESDSVLAVQGPFLSDASKAQRGPP